jgi:dTMP kinase
VRPDLTILLDIDPTEGLRRAVGAGSPDRMEAEDISFHTRVREGFLDYARRDPDRYHVIDASKHEDAVAADVLAVTLDRAAAHGLQRAASQ